ncbi:MAG: hypothetical protein J5833_03395 [Victivallales bacterium]|nr:hypothetical protein [Victivallales bacterium]
MRTNCPIEVIDLLREREAEFLRVWQCEQKVLQLLGVEEFPFSPPPDLPSRRKVVKGAGKASVPKKETVAAAPHNDMPLLEAGENAYRLVFIYNGKEESSFQTDRELIRNLLTIKSAEFELLSVETVKLTDMEHWERRRLLWSSEKA